MPRRLILGSSSRFRRKIFDEVFGSAANTEESSLWTTSCMSPDIDEKAIRHRDARTLTLLIANAKADALVEQLRNEEGEDFDAVLVCMDQVVCCNDEIREKPTSAEQVKEYLQSYRDGAEAVCVNGIVVHDLHTSARMAANELASVRFGSFSDDVIDDAIAQGRIFASAGAFAIEDPTFAPWITSVTGSRDAVIGLPLDSLRALLARVPTDVSTWALPDEFVPSMAVPGLRVRPLQPEDETAVRELVKAGMRETICRGLRDELLRPTAVGRWAVLVMMVAVGAALLTNLVPKVFALTGAALTITALVALVFGGVYRYLPEHVANGYLDGGECADLDAPSKHYLVRAGSCFGSPSTRSAPRSSAPSLSSDAVAAHPITAASRGTWATPSCAA